MTEKKGWGSTVLGWFVVQDEPADPGPGAADSASAPDASAIPAASFFQTDPPSAPDGRVDFDRVFDAAGIEQQERERVTKTGDLLASLPAGTDAAVKKQIVEASLKAFGVPIEKIVEGGVAEIQALEGYIRVGAADTQKLLEESAHRISQFEEEVRRIRAVMDQRVQEQQAVVQACNAKKLQVQQILEFFGQETVARVVRDSPKLHDPSAPASSAT